MEKGGTFLYPTDTIWGIGCHPFNVEAIQRVFELKKRSKEKNFILLVADLEMLQKYTSTIPSEIKQILVESKHLTNRC